ncbi:hypothetical protein [Bifidobacterium callimiconis]|uniref:Uncharacterized protein n=1 Tax=Bifidobacterium callimiconis TaxID=2306973 RepID=A0A430FBS8_9BIFI|nr:hypothetical protein [Bifidobacterium callimiconis]RSX50261.1 hypothetical protein D2E23_1809 [Bifidobacterium callimiconis]
MTTIHHMPTGPRPLNQLAAEVIGYITAYWQECSNGHNYLAINHDGRTARDMAYDYMTERYEDYLSTIDDEQGEGTLDELASQSPVPVDGGAAPIEQAMAAFDAMFDHLWPVAK